MLADASLLEALGDENQAIDLVVQVARNDPRVTPEAMILVGIAMMFFAFVLITQFAVWQYGRGAVQSAANEAARASAGFGADPGVCLEVFEAARGDLLGGSLGDGVGSPRCTVTGEFSEVVVPVRDIRGRAIGVLDVDSYDPGHFSEAHRKGYESIVRMLEDSWTS